MATIESPWKVFVMGIGFLFVVLSGTVTMSNGGADYPMMVGGLAIVAACAVSLMRGKRR